MLQPADRLLGAADDRDTKRSSAGEFPLRETVFKGGGNVAVRIGVAALDSREGMRTRGLWNRHLFVPRP